MLWRSRRPAPPRDQPPGPSPPAMRRSPRRHAGARARRSRTNRCDRRYRDARSSPARSPRRDGRSERRRRSRRAFARCRAHVWRGRARRRSWRSQLDSIVGRFDGDADVVRVRLAQTRARDADERRLRPKVLDGRGADVLHSRPQATDELVEEWLERTYALDVTLDAFGYELGELAHVLLTVAVARRAGLRAPARLHRAHRTHATVRLEAALGRLRHAAWRLVYARKKPAEHHGRCAGTDRLRDVARLLDPAVRDDRDAVPVGGF